MEAERSIEKPIRAAEIIGALSLATRLGLRLLNAPELWYLVRPVYAAGCYAEAAEMGLALIAARPDQAYLFYNVACCESLTGQTGRRDRAPAAFDRNVGRLS